MISGNTMDICGSMYSTSCSANQKYHIEHDHSEIWKQSEQQRIDVNSVDTGHIELQEEHTSKIANIEAEFRVYHISFIRKILSHQEICNYTI